MNKVYYTSSPRDITSASERQAYLAIILDRKSRLTSGLDWHTSVSKSDSSADFGYLLYVKSNNTRKALFSIEHLSVVPYNILITGNRSSIQYNILNADLMVRLEVKWFSSSRVSVRVSLVVHILFQGSIISTCTTQTDSIYVNYHFSIICVSTDHVCVNGGGIG